MPRELTIDAHYVPMPKQAQAHGLSAKYRGFVGGWGNGKTSWGCAEFFMSLMEFPRTNSIVARKTRPELKSTTWDMLVNGDTSQPNGWHGIPKEVIATYNKSDLYIELRNGSKIWGLPLDDPKKIENYNLGLFWIDQAEEIEEDIFLKFQGRLRQLKAPREGLLTWNPAGHNWLWRRFIKPDRPPEHQRIYQAIEATTYDNPNLPEDYLDQFSGLPEAWIQRFVMGSHEVFVGQIFTDWDPEVHVIQPFRIPREWERWLCIDPGIRHEGAISWLARDSLGNAYYYRELLEANQPIEWWAAQIFRMEAADDYGGPDEEIARRLIGPEARIRSQTDGKSVVDLYHENGIFPEFTDRDPGARISVITQYLRPRDGHRNPFTGVEPAPRLYVFDTCDWLKEYLPQYQWRPQRTNFAEEDAPEKVRKKDDHNIDNLGHILVAADSIPPIQGPPAFRTTEQQLLEETFRDALESSEQTIPLTVLVRASKGEIDLEDYIEEVYHGMEAG